MVNRKNRCDFFYFTAKKFKFRCSWLQVAQQLSPFNVPIIGVDICSIKPLKGCITLKGDIKSSSCFFSIYNIIKKFEQEINIILHDGSPKMGNKWLSDVYKQNELVLNAFKLIKDILICGGWFITKIFKSEFFNNLFFILKIFFKKIFIFKPIASRNSSSEVYLVCYWYFNNVSKYNLLLEANFVFKQNTVPKNDLNKNIIKFDKCNEVFNFSNLIKIKNFFFKKFYILKKKDEDECLFGTDFYGAKFLKQNSNQINLININLNILNWLEKNF